MRRRITAAEVRAWKNLARAARRLKRAEARARATAYGRRDKEAAHE